MSNAHRARKRFGQNFLNNEPIIQQLVAAIAVKPDDHVLEIGPGLAAMTRPLLAQLAQLEVIELDRDLVTHLENLSSAAHQLIIHQGDALEFDFSAATHRRRVVGNLPYNISTPLIFHLLDHLENIVDMHFMLQKEVVDKICAVSGDRNFGRLSAMVQSQCQVVSLFAIGPENFTPAPKVNSAFLRLIPQPRVPEHLRSQFANVVRLAFTQPRKTLANNLKPHISSEQIESLELSPSTRPQNLSITDLVKLAHYL